MSRHQIAKSNSNESKVASKSRLSGVAKRITAFGLVTVAIAASQTGCRICAECDIDDYAAYGSNWPRLTRDRGRVGSIFDPAAAESSRLSERDSALSPIERARQEGDSRDNDDGFDVGPSNEANPSDQQRLDDLRNLNVDDLQAENSYFRQ